MVGFSFPKLKTSTATSDSIVSKLLDCTKIKVLFAQKRCKWQIYCVSSVLVNSCMYLQKCSQQGEKRYCVCMFLMLNTCALLKVSLKCYLK